MLLPLLRKIKHSFFPKPIVYTVVNSYSQAGEDRILHFLFNSVGISKPSYIDIGANKPDIGSNTFMHYQLNESSGVCLEPDPHLFKLLQTARPRDTCLNMAIGFDDATEADFFIFNEPSLNTMSEEEALARDAVGEYKLTHKIKTQVVRLEHIINTYFKELPDYVSLDVEGVDFLVLQSFDFEQYPVPVWIVETVDYSINHIKPKRTSIIDFMQGKGYFVYGDTYINTIFVHHNWYNHFRK